MVTNDVAKNRRAYIKAICERFAFSVVGIDEDRSTLRFTCSSFSTSGTEYEQTRHVYNGSVSCSCPDFAIRRERDYPTWESPNVCKHIAMWRMLLESA